MISIFLAVLVSSASAITFDKNVPQDIVNQINDDMSFVSTIQGSKQTPLHQQIFNSIDGATYKKFFETRVTSVGLSNCGNGNAVACVQPLWAPNKMWLTNNYIKFSHPQIARLMVIFHEARHTERQNGNWGHATCPRPFLDENGKNKVSVWTGAPLAGEAACDVTPLGSYGSSTIMLKNIAMNCSNCSDKVRMDADLYAADQLGRISDENVKKKMLDDFTKSRKKHL
jgi:hypothetical protein